MAAFANEVHVRCRFRLASFAVWVGLSGTALAASGAGMPDLAEPAKTGQKAPKDAAVVIGVENYTDVPAVPYARRDAEAFDTFVRYTRGIPDDRVALLRDARAYEIEKAVKAAGARVGPGGRVWVYFAGHGAMEPNGTARLLLGRDAATDPDAFSSFAVSVDDVREWATAGGGEAVLVIDACYNGGGRTGEGVLTGGRRMAVPDYAMVGGENSSEWAATGPKELSQPLVAVEHGAFTYFAVGALRGWADGEVDGRRDGNVTGEEANRYVSRALRSIQTQGQTPQLASEDGAALVLARGVKEVGPGKEAMLALRDNGDGARGAAAQGAVTVIEGAKAVSTTWTAADDQVLSAMEVRVRSEAHERGKAEQDADGAQRVAARQAAVAADWAALQSAVGVPSGAPAASSTAVRAKLDAWKADSVEVPGRRVALTGSLAWNGRTKDLSGLSEEVPARRLLVAHPKEIAAAEGWLAAAKVAVVSGGNVAVVGVAPVGGAATPQATLTSGGEVKPPSDLEKKAESLRLESIERLKELLQGSGVEGETKAEMLLRLADLYFQEGRYLHLREVDDHAVSSSWFTKSIKLYRQVLANYPQFARADEASFSLGQALRDTGALDEANTELTRLVKTYPDSRYIAEAYLLIGEYYFEKNEAYKALLSYQRAATYKNFEKRDFALYKLAWCYFNVGEHGKAIDTMKAVVVAPTPSGRATGSQLSLQTEAGKDLARFYRDAGDVEGGAAWFRSVGRTDFAAMVEGG